MVATDFFTNLSHLSLSLSLSLSLYLSYSLHFCLRIIFEIWSKDSSSLFENGLKFLEQKMMMVVMHEKKKNIVLTTYSSQTLSSWMKVVGYQHSVTGLHKRNSGTVQHWVSHFVMAVVFICGRGGCNQYIPVNFFWYNLKTMFLVKI